MKARVTWTGVVVLLLAGLVYGVVSGPQVVVVENKTEATVDVDLEFYDRTQISGIARGAHRVVRLNSRPYRPGLNVNVRAGVERVDFPGCAYNGGIPQVTDIQVWDHPIRVVCSRRRTAFLGL
jgi:hypothetical protein